MSGDLYQFFSDPVPQRIYIAMPSSLSMNRTLTGGTEIRFIKDQLATALDLLKAVQVATSVNISMRIVAWSSTIVAEQTWPAFRDDKYDEAKVLIRLVGANGGTIFSNVFEDAKRYFATSVGRATNTLVFITADVDEPPASAGVTAAQPLVVGLTPYAGANEVNVSAIVLGARQPTVDAVQNTGRSITVTDREIEAGLFAQRVFSVIQAGLGSHNYTSSDVEVIHDGLTYEPSTIKRNTCLLYTSPSPRD